MNFIKGRTMRSGASIVELCIGLLIVIPVCLLLLNLAIFIFGIQTNEQACREAARVAASGDPDSAQLRALTIIEKANETKPDMIISIRLVSVVNAISANDFKAVKIYGGTVAGQVTVTTAADIKPLLGSWLLANHQFWTAEAKCSFPYTYVVERTGRHFQSDE